MPPFFVVYLSKVKKMINSVRNAVLAILNKNNYGYVSPQDFNLMAQNAQMEIYEEYYSNYNKVVNAENLRSSGTQYADIRKPISEVLESFLVRKPLVPKYLNNFYYPSLITTGDSVYMLNKIMYYSKMLVNSTNTSVSPEQLVDTSGDYLNKGVKVGDVVTNSTTFQSTVVMDVLSATTLILFNDIFTAIGQDYYIYDSNSFAEVEKVSNSNILNLVKSNLTGPSEAYPAYSNISDVLTIYPTTIQNYGSIQADYFRHPKPPKWTYITLSGGEPAFDQSQPDYQDFELPLEDEYKLVTKILEYCGIIIREMEVSQFGTAQQQHEQPTFSMQQ